MTVLDYRSGIDERSARSSVFSWISWAVYLGMSWTWCIGMFLPVLMIRDYGRWAWVAFAVPNVVGAAAMGWISKSTSERIRAEHVAAIKAFSIVTATFQIFFAIWVFHVMGAANSSVWEMLGIALLVFIMSRTHNGLALAAASIVLLLSIGCMLITDSTWKSYGVRELAEHPFPPVLIALTPVCVFGFLLCPYLDGTFHYARQSLCKTGGRVAFGLGFGVFFLAMILFTFQYASPVITWLRFRDQPWGSGALGDIAAYWMVQLALTTGFHWAVSAEARGAFKQDETWVRALGTTVLALGIAATTQWIAGETIYRLFMAFYGLIFPAYVWLCMIPTWRNPSKPLPHSLAVFAASVLLASPFYWLGFIEGKMAWLVAGLGIVLLARLLIRRPVPLPQAEA